MPEMHELQQAQADHEHDMEHSKRRHQLQAGECSTCDGERLSKNLFHPPHDASPRCESGKHYHCSCDICF